MPVKIGAAGAIFRYPVKSMSGERLEVAGVISNCMSCHRRAAVGYAFDIIGDTIVANVANYGPAANVLPGDSLIFNIPIPPVPGVHGTVKTDFHSPNAARAYT